MTYDIQKVLNVAFAEVGYLEKKSNSDLYNKTANAGSNNYNKYAYEMDTKYPDFYNGKKNGYAWCDVFVDYLFVKAYGVNDALKLLGQPLKSCGAGCVWSAKYFKQIKCFDTTPKVGDQIFFKDSKGEPCHTGIVYQVDDLYVYTIEGNTSSQEGVVANGGCVAQKKYAKTYNRIYGYGRPNYGDQSKFSSAVNSQSATQSAIKNWQLSAIQDGYKFPKYGADGQWGSECESVAKVAICKKYSNEYKNKNLTKIIQSVVGVAVDGLFGANTKQAVIIYQKKNKLIADGVVGYNTWKVILGIK